MVARHGAALLRVANQFSLCHDDALDAYQRGWRSTCAGWRRSIRRRRAPGCGSWSNTRRWRSGGRAGSVDRDDLALDDTSTAGCARSRTPSRVASASRSVEALHALKPDEARALLLKAEGLSYQEIGRRFGWTYTKVKRMDHRRPSGAFSTSFGEIEAGETCERSRGSAQRARGRPRPRGAPGRAADPARTCATARRAGPPCVSCASPSRAGSRCSPPFAWIARLLSRPEVFLFAASAGGEDLRPASGERSGCA